MEQSAAGDKINELAKEFMGDNPGIEYSDALAHVMQENAQITQDYYFSSETAPARVKRESESYAEKKDASEELDAQARLLALKSKVSYEQALNCVLQMPRNSELAALYMDN